LLVRVTIAPIAAAIDDYVAITVADNQTEDDVHW
jgi:hypothetical protein